jgi:glycosyltransferase involved in cell wall biosynthesis
MTAGWTQREPEVTVVVPTKDRDALLGQTLRSIRRQQDVDFEVVVVDDGSADPALVARIVADVADPRFRVVRHEQSRGVSAARNRGAAEAAAPWVAFCDDDDLWAPDKLAKQLAAVREACVDWVYVGSVNVTVGNRVVGGKPPLTPDQVAEQLEERNVVPGGSSGVLTRRDVLLDAGGFDPGLQPLADWDLWLRLLRVSPPASVAEPLVAYRVHGTNMSLDTRRMRADFATFSKRYPRANRAVLFRYLGWRSIRVNRHAEAARQFLRAAVERDGQYPLAVVRQDLWYLVRHAVTSLRARLAPRMPPRWPRVSVAEEQLRWRERGQQWVDQLTPS